MGIKFIYTLFVGLLVAAFIGFGIDTFYVAPKAPDYPSALSAPAPIEKNGVETPEQKQLREKYDADFKAFQETEAIYNRNVSMIALVAAILVLIVSLVLANRIAIMADGLLLGGTLTLFYSIIRGMMSQAAGYRFAVISVGLVVTLVIGYLKFVRGKDETPKTKSARV